eukprot:SAG11_NODE_6964_length_1218_cov_1.279714_2_plen_236_part_00
MVLNQCVCLHSRLHCHRHAHNFTTRFRRSWVRTLTASLLLRHATAQQQACPAGSFGSPLRGIACLPCAAGTFCPMIGCARCLDCNAAGTTSCDPVTGFAGPVYDGCGGYGLPADGSGHDPTPCGAPGVSPSQAMCVYGDHCMCSDGYVCADTLVPGECTAGTGGSVFCIRTQAPPPPPSLIAPSPAPHTITSMGNPSCWAGAYTSDRCCSGRGGDHSCWGGGYTYAMCCNNDDGH